MEYQPYAWPLRVTLSGPCPSRSRNLTIWPFLSRALYMLARWFFLFLRFLRSCNAMALSVTLYKPRVTLNFKVTRPYRWPLLSRALYMLERWFFLFLRFLRSCNAMALSVTLYKPRVTLNFKVTRSYRWPLLSRALYMLERWFFFVSTVFSGRAMQWHYQWPRTNHAWPWTSRSRDLTGDLCYLGHYTC